MTDVYVSWTDRQSQPGVCRRRRGHLGASREGITADDVTSAATTSSRPHRLCTEQS